MPSLRSIRSDLSSEWAPTLSLAGPVVLGHLGMMLMGLVDTACVAPLGARAVGAVGVGGSILGLAFLVGLGLLLGIDREVAVAHGAGRPDGVARAHAQGVILSVAISVPLAGAVLFAAGHLRAFGVAPELVPDAAAWLRAAVWSLPPAFVFMALRQSLQAVGDTRAATFLLLVANGVNVFFNVALIRGRFGFPALGVAGSGWATVAARVFTAACLAAWSARRGPSMRDVGWGLHAPTMRELLRLGVPAAVQLLFEGGVFSTTTLLCARLGAVPAAAHQVVLQIASFTFMVPLGLSAAGAVRVGNAIGRGEPEAAARAGWSAVVLAVGFMAFSALALVTAAPLVLGLFGLDGPTAALARTLLLVAALFQLFDGCQVSVSGVLRGSGDTVASMAANLVGHWFIGLPVGVALGFGLGAGAVGLWGGLATGLGAVAIALVALWARRIGRIVRGEIRGTTGAAG
ncbi:MAG: MATE family efflux transporter [Polyangiales bacterium]